MSQDVQLYSQFTDPLAACERLGTALAKSGLFGCDRAEQGQALMLICMSERKSPTEILRNFDIVEGKLRKKALAILAEFRQRGGKHKWLADGSDGQAAEIELTFEGQTIKSRFTMDDARRANASFKQGSAWVKTPGNMLRARAASNGVAMLCPEVVAGSEEEAENTPAPAAPLDLTPRTVAPATAPTPARPTEPTPAPATVIDIPATVSRTEPPQDAAALAAAGLAPAEPVPTPPATAKPASGFVTPQTAAALEELIGPNFDRAMAWFVKEKWLAEGESILRLTETRAQRIVKQAKSWLRAIGAEVAK